MAICLAVMLSFAVIFVHVASEYKTNRGVKDENKPKWYKPDKRI